MTTGRPYLRTNSRQLSVRCGFRNDSDRNVDDPRRMAHNQSSPLPADLVRGLEEGAL